MKAYAQVDTEGLHTLGTVIVDYRGYRVTAQSIIPGTPSTNCTVPYVKNTVYILPFFSVSGILEKEQEQSVVYGSVDFGKTVVPNEKYNELVSAASSSYATRFGLSSCC